jgi:hypothetical protein
MKPPALEEILAVSESPPADASAENDPLLALYLRAESDEVATAQLSALLGLYAGPIIAGILRAKQTGALAGIESEDITAAAREQLIRQLTFLRRGERAAPIQDFRAYAATVTYSVWMQALRALRPRRAALCSRLRYMLENRTTQIGFGIWTDADGLKWCGLAPWYGRTGGATPRRHWLLSDPQGAAREALPHADPAEASLPDLVASLFRWLGGPIELRDLTNVVAKLTGISESNAPGPTTAPPQVDPRQSPAEDLVWKEYLGWLWREVGSLSERQRRAFLLHADVLREFDVFAIAPIRMLAGPLGFSPNELAELWPRLPLDDLAIAQLLACTRQQVINLRRVARDKLGAAWQKWSGNKGAESSSG